MPVPDSQWITVAPSEFPWEQEALDFLRANLTAVVGAWSNFEFVAPGGNIYEVDLMVLTPTEVCLVEIKSWGGILEGHPNALQRRPNDAATPYPVDNPLVLTNRKAKVLAGLVKDQPSMRNLRTPYFRAVLFLNNHRLDLRIPPRDRPNIYHHREIIEGLKPQPGKLKDPGVKLDKARVAALGKAFRSLGIRRRNRTLRVGEWVLDELLEDSERYQDHLAHHTTIQESFRRVRTYTVPAGAPEGRQELARRAARREFQLTDSLHHPGILKPLEFVYHDYGPALVYFYDKEAVRLDQFLASRRDLGLEQRLDLVRQLADILRYAHARRVYHRGLAPQSVLVLRPQADKPQLQVMNWQTGMEKDGTAGTAHISDLMDNAAKAYLAPEAVSQPAAASGELVDIFALGAVAYHILTGQPPAESHLHLYQKLSEHPGLRLSSVSDGPWSDLELLVERSTRPQVVERPATIQDFLDQLDEAEGNLLGIAEEQVTNPLEAQPGDRLPGGFTVYRKLGKGGVAVALEVIRDEQSYVLKVAHEQGHNERMRCEAEALRKLDHPHIARLFGVEEMGGRTCLLLQKAGNQTLSQRLAERGPLQLELLERFGEDLLSAAVYLEKVGIHHRDIKPANLGVSMSRRDDALHLVLFDFSLAATPAENVGAGTPDYLDPFLKLEKPARWDLGAERYSAAVTLYEMATGTLPRWGDGQSDPGLDRKARLVLEADRFDPALRESLTGFFEKALARVRRERFDNAEEMLAAWKAVFARGETTSVTETVDTDELRRRIDGADTDSTLASLGLGTRVLRALDHLGAVRVEELLALPTHSLLAPAGVGASTRKELVAIQQMLRERFPEDEMAPIPEPGELGAGVLEPLLERILGKKGTQDRELREAYLGLTAAGSDPVWPTLAELAGQLALEPQSVARKVPALRRAWVKLAPLGVVRDELHELLSENAGLMTVEEAALGMLSRRGALSNDPVRRQRMAAAVVRAAVEAEQTDPGERYLWQRLGQVLVVARTSEHLRYAEQLGQRADELATREPLPSPQRIQEELRLVPGPEDADRLTPHRLVRLAAGFARGTAVSSREELYPRGMEARRALILAHGVLVGEARLAPKDMRERVLSRYPESEPLPERPELDALVAEADPDLLWAPEEGAYRRQTAALTGSSDTTLFRRFSTTGGAVGASPEIAEARRFEDRLAHAIREDAFVVLMVEPQAAAQAEEELLRRFPALVRRSLDRMVLQALRETAAVLRVSWDVVLETDARPGTQDWKRLMSLVTKALPTVEKHLIGADTPQLLVHPGLLARYGQMALLERLRDAAGARDGIPAVWLLLPVETGTELPTLEGEAVPLLHSGQRARIPTAWLENRHRGAREEVLS